MNSLYLIILHHSKMLHRFNWTFHSPIVCIQAIIRELSLHVEK